MSRHHLIHMKEHWFFHNCKFETLDQLVPKLNLLFSRESIGDVGIVALKPNNKGKITDKRVSKLMMQLWSCLEEEKEKRYVDKIEFW